MCALEKIREYLFTRNLWLHICRWLCFYFFVIIPRRPFTHTLPELSYKSSSRLPLVSVYCNVEKCQYPTALANFIPISFYSPLTKHSHFLLPELMHVPFSFLTLVLLQFLIPLCQKLQGWNVNTLRSAKIRIWCLHVWNKLITEPFIRNSWRKLHCYNGTDNSGLVRNFSLRPLSDEPIYIFIDFSEFLIPRNFNNNVTDRFHEWFHTVPMTSPWHKLILIN